MHKKIKHKQRWQTLICELSHFYKLDVSPLYNIFQKWFKVTVEDNDQTILVYIQTFTSDTYFKKIKLKK